ncbi:TOBE domain-containing protein, partial [Acinetobacter baumannii]
DGDILVVRPEQCAVGEAVNAKAVQRSATVEMREFVGPHARLRLKVEGSDLPWLVLCASADAQGLTIGSTTRFGFDPAASARVRA